MLDKELDALCWHHATQKLKVSIIQLRKKVLAQSLKLPSRSYDEDIKTHI